MLNRNGENGYVTYCGVYCGACSHKLTGVTQDPRHMTEKARQLDPEELKYWTSCPGCRIGKHRDDCDFKICAKGKNLDLCVDCPSFPCKFQQEFNSDGVPHHAGSLASLAVLKEQGQDAWLAVQREKWTCDCGAKLSWYLKQCLKCGQSVQEPSPK